MPRSDCLEWPIRSGQPRLGRCTLFAALFVAALLQADPSVVLGLVERDLTGDGKPEVLRLVGVGPIDNLAVTFTIEAAGKTIYRFDLAPLTRTVGFDAGRQVISTEAHRARIKEFGPWFFAEEKFQRPDEFVAWLGRAARLRLEIPEVIARDRQVSDTVDGSVIWQESRRLLSPSSPFRPAVTHSWRSGGTFARVASTGCWNAVSDAALSPFLLVPDSTGEPLL